jgi:hypothetical protein
MTITNVKLLQKQGGKSGHWVGGKKKQKPFSAEQGR